MEGQSQVKSGENVGVTGSKRPKSSPGSVGKESQAFPPPLSSSYGLLLLSQTLYCPSNALL